MTRPSFRGIPTGSIPIGLHEEISSNGHVNESGTSSNVIPMKDSFPSFSEDRTLFSECLESCFSQPEANISPSPFSVCSTPFRKRQWSALQFIMVSFASVFVFIGVLGLSNQSYSMTRLPKLELYKTYRRLQLESNYAELTERGIFGMGAGRSKELEACPEVLEHVVPCYNVSASLDAGFTDGEEFDRHCDLARREVQCYIRAPAEYRISPQWPACRDRVWSSNVKTTREQLLEIGSRTKRLMVVDASVVLFQSEDDAQIADGSENYAHQISTMIGVENDSLFIKAGVRTVLDIGCGYGSLGAHLLSRNVLSLCLAPYETHSSQVQFALERGLPAMIGSLLKKQLPFSAASFDMVHCAECGVDWSQKEGIHLMEVDRILRPGGYFVWTSALSNPGQTPFTEDQKKWKSTKEVFKRMCWDLLSQQEQTFIWRKKSDQSCYLSRELNTTPSICDSSKNKDAGLYRPIRQCIVTTSMEQHHLLPNYLVLPSGGPFKGYLAEELSGDLTLWSATVKSYWSLLTPLIFSDHPKRPGEDDPLPPANIVRNVMDMNAAFGNFNAGLLHASKPVWVMNVVPTSGPNSLPVIYNRGMIGAAHDWCEAFPTYPRTYDLLHAIGLLSQELERSNGCSLSNIFLEMDRVLRPEGWVFIRDRSDLIEDARVAALQMRWETRVVDVEGDSELKLLVCQKNFLKNK